MKVEKTEIESAAKQQRKWPLRRISKYAALGLLIYILFLFSPIAFFFGPILAGRAFPIFKSMSRRPTLSYARTTLGHYGRVIDAYEREHGPFPGGVYWGPFNPELIQKLTSDSKIAPRMYQREGQPNPPSALDELIDPYNREGPSRSWRHGMRFVDDHGNVVYVKGGNFQFYSNGRNNWMLISRGPDGKLDMTKELLGKTTFSTTRPIFLSSSIINLTYDPTNGEISAGDIWRVKQD